MLVTKRITVICTVAKQFNFYGDHPKKDFTSVNELLYSKIFFQEDCGHFIGQNTRVLRWQPSDIVHLSYILPSIFLYPAILHYSHPVPSNFLPLALLHCIISSSPVAATTPCPPVFLIRAIHYLSPPSFPAPANHWVTSSLYSLAWSPPFPHWSDQNYS